MYVLYLVYGVPNCNQWALNSLDMYNKFNSILFIIECRVDLTSID